MKLKNSFIIGILSLCISLVISTDAQAANYCKPETGDTEYKKIYCKINAGDNNADADKKVLKTVARQFDLRLKGSAIANENLVEGILSNTICESLEDPKANLDRIPEEIKIACLPGTSETQELFAAQDLFSDVRNAYEKEKAMHFNAASLEMKFKASEDFYDGKVGGPLDAPFDLIADLNLIEIILFGSRADWMNDVFKFPDQEEDEDGGDDDIPLPDPDADTGDDEGDSIEDPDDPGLTNETQETQGTEGECVPPDDPEADPEAEPQNPLCGNSELDILLGEQCDDGNLVSGDGCNQFCQLEELGSGDVCADPEAVTFKEPGDGGGPNGNGEDGNECPPGTVPKKKAEISGEGAAGAAGAPQIEGYPGPSVGGVMKQFPESNAPACPEGYFDAKAEASSSGVAQDSSGNDTGSQSASASVGGTDTFGVNVAGYQFDVPACLPTEFCADFDVLRDALFGDEWENDESLNAAALAVEGLFCVNIIKNNRPVSGYGTNEGCIDCHISAMVDSLEESLATNVSPLENTTSSFAISSKFGPNMSFNLFNATKKKHKLQLDLLRKTAVSEGINATRKAEREAEPPKPATDGGQSGLQQLTSNTAEQNRIEGDIDQAIQEYTYTNDSISDQRVGLRASQTLIEMNELFATMNMKWFNAVNTSELINKNTCQ